MIAILVTGDVNYGVEFVL